MAKTNQYMLDGVPSFIIDSMYARQHEGLGVDTAEVVVTIKTPAKLFVKLQKKGDLESLYLDVSNEIHSLNPNIPAWCPTVDSKSRASNGIKTITLYYHVMELHRAKALGIPVLEFKGGWTVQYSAHVDLMVRRKPELKIVGGAR